MPKRKIKKQKQQKISLAKNKKRPKSSRILRTKKVIKRLKKIKTKKSIASIKKTSKPKILELNTQSSLPAVKFTTPVLETKVIPALPAPAVQPAVLPTVATISPRPEKPLLHQKKRVSPYILDLKKIQEEKSDGAEDKHQLANYISQELTNKIKTRRQSLQHNLSNYKKAVTASLDKIKLPTINLPATKLVSNQPLVQTPKPNFAAKIKLPKISLPQINWQLPQIRIPEIKLGNLVMPSFWPKAIFSFVSFCIILTVSFSLPAYYHELKNKKNTVLGIAGQALLHLTLSQKAASAQDLYYTQDELNKAAASFEQANTELNDINLLVKGLIKIIPDLNKQYTTAENLTLIGEKLTSSAALLTSTFNQLNFDKSADSLYLSKKIIVLKESLNIILPDIKTANEALQNVYLEEIPAEYQDKIILLQKNLPVLQRSVEEFISYADLLAQVLGQESKKRYLLLFQNNNEIRPTGGFIGSYALVDIDQGNLSKISIPGGGPYDLKSGLRVNISSPRPLHIMNQRWEFQDANWFADLPTSAEKLLYFFEKSGGPTVDGLIFINATFLEQLLTITGEIKLPEHNKTISSGNFFNEVQNSVELEYDKVANRPKQIIADLAPKLMTTLLNSDQKQFTGILDLLLNSLKEKEIQFYFTDYNLEKIVLDNNWGGELKKSELDYLNIVSTNIAGEKSDAKITQQADLQVNIQADGSVINKLTITKNHSGQPGEKFYGVPNVDYLRIYLPLGSQLLKAEGFDVIPEEFFETLNPEIYDQDPDLTYIESQKIIDPQSKTEIFEESGKTVFANWLKVEPGKSKTITIEYKLPFTLNLQTKPIAQNYFQVIKTELNITEPQNQTEKYLLLWQKQAGKRNFTINVQINFPTNFNYQLSYPGDLLFNNNSYLLNDDLNSDKLIAVIFNAK